MLDSARVYEPNTPAEWLLPPSVRRAWLAVEAFATGFASWRSSWPAGLRPTKACGSTTTRRANSSSEKYGFELTDAWLEHLQMASVRFSGGSGEFVSEDGLVLSNHHVGSRALQRLSTREHNYLRDGFYARTRAEEKPCPASS